MRLLVNRGFRDSVFTGDEVVNYNFTTQGVSDSFTAEQAEDIFNNDGELAAVNDTTATFSLREKRRSRGKKLSKRPCIPASFHLIRGKT